MSDIDDPGVRRRRFRRGRAEQAPGAVASRPPAAEPGWDDVAGDDDEVWDDQPVPRRTRARTTGEMFARRPLPPPAAEDELWNPRIDQGRDRGLPIPIHQEVDAWLDSDADTFDDAAVRSAGRWADRSIVPANRGATWDDEEPAIPVPERASEAITPEATTPEGTAAEPPVPTGWTVAPSEPSAGAAPVTGEDTAVLDFSEAERDADEPIALAPHAPAAETREADRAAESWDEPRPERVSDDLYLDDADPLVQGDAPAEESTGLRPAAGEADLGGGDLGGGDLGGGDLGGGDLGEADLGGGDPDLDDAWTHSPEHTPVPALADDIALAEDEDVTVDDAEEWGAPVLEHEPAPLPSPTPPWSGSAPADATATAVLPDLEATADGPVLVPAAAWVGTVSTIGHGLATVAGAAQVIALAHGLATGEATPGFDLLHRIGAAFTAIGPWHGLMLVLALVLVSLPALLGDPDADQYDGTAATAIGVSIVSAVVGILGAVLAFRFSLRVDDLAAGAGTTTSLLAHLVALVTTAGTSLIAFIAGLVILRSRTETDTPAA